MLCACVVQECGTTNAVLKIENCMDALSFRRHLTHVCAADSVIVRVIQ